MYQDINKNIKLMENTQLVKEQAAPERRRDTLDIFNAAFKLTEEDIATGKDMSNRDKLPKETELFKGEEEEETTEPIDGGKVKPADGKEVKENADPNVDALAAFFQQPEHADFFKSEVNASKDLPTDQRFHIMHDHLADYAKTRGQQTEGADMYAVVNRLLSAFDVSLTFKAAQESKIPSDILQADQDKLLKDLLEKNGLNERTTWIDVGFKDTPDLTGHKLEYIPTGEKFDIAGTDEKFIQLAQELPADKEYIGADSKKKIAVGDGLAYSHKWRLLDPQDKEVAVGRKDSFESQLPDLDKDSQETIIKKLTEMSDDPADLAPQADKQYLGASGQNVFYVMFDKDENGVIRAAAIYDAVGDKIKEMPNERNVDNVGMLVDIVRMQNLDTVSFKLLTELGIIKTKEEDKIPHKEETPEDENPAEPKPEAAPEAPKEPGEQAGTEAEDTEPPIESRKPIKETNKIQVSLTLEKNKFYTDYVEEGDLETVKNNVQAAVAALRKLLPKGDWAYTIDDQPMESRKVREASGKKVNESYNSFDVRFEASALAEMNAEGVKQVIDTALDTIESASGVEVMMDVIVKQRTFNEKKIREDRRSEAIAWLKQNIEDNEKMAKQHASHNPDFAAAFRAMANDSRRLLSEIEDVIFKESKIPSNLLTADQGQLAKDLLEKYGLKEEAMDDRYALLLKVAKAKKATLEELAQLEQTGGKPEAFNVKLTKEEAIRLLKDGVGDVVMNKEYGEDEDWNGMTAEDIATLEEFPEYKTFELWLDDAIHQVGVGDTIQLDKPVDAVVDADIDDIETSGLTGESVRTPIGKYIVEDIVKSLKGRVIVLRQQGGKEFIVRENSLLKHKK